MDRYPIPPPSTLKNILRQKIPTAPLTAMIHIIEHCNVRCEFCWHHSFLRKDLLRPQRMETSTVINMIEELARMGTTDITLSANGEPTLHPGFPSIVHAIKNHKMKLKVVTNLTLFSPEIATALSQTDLLVINLAVTNDSEYQAIYAPKGAVSFAQVTENIKKLSMLQSHKGPQVKIGYVITKNTFRHIAKIIELADACRVDSIRFKFMDPSSFTQSLILDNVDRQWLFSEITRIIKKTTSVTTNLQDILHTLSPPITQDTNLEEKQKHGRCFIGWIVMNINENGSVTLCCQNDQLIIGNWKEKSLRTIWEGEKAQEFRNQAKTKIDFNNPRWHACRGCAYSNPFHYTRRINHIAV
jgi:wyosine [tRNA(Phe)-imidazoG37] synthetase (radical SAM superfamily)